MLEETSLAYEPHRIDIMADENHDPAFLALNPNGKIPAIYDTDGPSGHAQLLDRLGPERFQGDRAGDRAPRGRRGLPVLPRRRPGRRHDRASRAACRTLSLAGPSNEPVLLIGAGSGVVPLIAMIRYRKASGEPVPVALLLSSRTYKSRSSFLRAFRQVHGYVPAESEGNGQNSD